jgi:tungstate transport system substrate-binding protein
MSRGSAVSTGAPGNRPVNRGIVLLAATLLLSACAPRGPRPILVLATTTSVGYSGLLDAITPAFTTETGIEVRVHLVGSGLALAMLDKRDADAAISHAPALEAAALRAHPDWWYRKILFNDFVLVGPPDDPVRVSGASTIAEAMRRVARARFISRGDQSGTHEREKELWTIAGMSGDDVIVAGQGMGPTLRMASEAKAYTLTDRATFLRLHQSVRLEVVFEGGRELLNTYAVIAVPSIDVSMRFGRWLAEGNGRARLEQVTANERVPGFTVWPRDARRDRPEASPFGDSR